MKRVKDRQRTELFSEYMLGLPAQRRGEVLLVLWMNAMLTLVIDAAWLVLAARALGGREAATVADWRRCSILRDRPALW